MNMLRRFATAALVALLFTSLAVPNARAHVTIDWVTVGNPGNANDTLAMIKGPAADFTTGYGSVGYSFQMSKYAVTNSQDDVGFVNLPAGNWSHLGPNGSPATATFTGPGAGGPFSLTATAASGLFVLPSTLPGGGNWLSTNIPRESIEFTITGATATGFGMFPFLTDFLGNLLSGTMQLTVNGASSYTLNDLSPTNFFGLMSTDPINSITLQYLGSDDAFVTTGQITLGVTAVPEPTTYAMALAGLACGGFSMWRRRKRA